MLIRLKRPISVEVGVKLWRSNYYFVKLLVKKVTSILHRCAIDTTLQQKSRKKIRLTGMVIYRYTRHISWLQQRQQFTSNLCPKHVNRLTSAVLCCCFPPWHQCVQCSIWRSLHTPRKDNQILSFN